METRWFLPGVILSGQCDRVMMANAVEGRFPFLDPRTVEFSNALPAGLKIKVLCEKFLPKKSSARFVPPQIAARKKQPYQAPNAGQVFGPELPFLRLRPVASTSHNSGRHFRRDSRKRPG